MFIYSGIKFGLLCVKENFKTFKAWLDMVAHIFHWEEEAETSNSL